MSIYHFPSTVHNLGLYPIVDNTVWIARLLKLGVRTLQIRIKNKPNTLIEKQIIEATTICKYYQARLFINDYWELAIKYNSYGIHLGQEDLNFANLQEISKSKIRLGISTHNDFELNKALDIKPSYIAIGHIFPTTSKIMNYPPQGVTGLKKHLKKLSHIPTVAIGGISMKNISSVLETGVGGIAVISAITKSSNWSLVTKNLLTLIQKQEKRSYYAK